MYQQAAAGAAAGKTKPGSVDPSPEVPSEQRRCISTYPLDPCRYMGGWHGSLTRYVRRPFLVAFLFSRKAFRYLHAGHGDTGDKDLTGPRNYFLHPNNNQPAAQKEEVNPRNFKFLLAYSSPFSSLLHPIIIDAPFNHASQGFYIVLTTMVLVGPPANSPCFPRWKIPLSMLCLHGPWHP